MAYVKNPTYKGYNIGDWVVTTKKVDSLAGYFEKGTKVKVIDITHKGYDLEDEFGNQVTEAGFDCVKADKTVCSKCGRHTGEMFNTVYGDARCENCTYDYMMTDRGKVEYFISIPANPETLDEYDADFLGHVAACWIKYRDELEMPYWAVCLFEQRAKQLGMF